ncbi:RNA polymerase sigma factor [Nostocoides jenkinsii]|uniref:RNA polymerase sigma factor n=1 Tax=Nostocoides jenkinsii TaxID=330834 RepID=UPI000A0227EB|nr:SigE family RNA polymerase sigma factor [Tetrasphaera jenkinsii]
MTAYVQAPGLRWGPPRAARGVPVVVDSGLDFDAFYRDTSARVVHLVYASTGNLTLAQDCTQEAYARAWQRWGSVSRADDPLSWVRTVARRLAISQWRKDTNRAEAHRQLSLVQETATISPERVVIVEALKSLSAQHREVLALHYLLDMSVEAIAADLGAPAGTVKARLHHGRKALAAALGGKEAHHG